MSKPAHLVRRNVAARVRRALEHTPVVLLNGARQTGKSTLAQELIREGYKADYVTLDDAGRRAAALDDPDGFIASFSRSAVIDEVQRAPGLFPAIKASVDRDRRPGRFLLTGSADVLLLPSISESLAGRIQIATLWPFSQGELAGRLDTFVDGVFSERLPSISEDRVLRSEVLHRALEGGFPEAIAHTDPEIRADWFDSYVDTILQREVRELSRIEGLADLPRLLALLAGRAASILNAAELARASGFNYMTLRRYLALLEKVFFIHLIPSWSGSMARRLVRHPKLMLVDGGLLAHLLSIDLTRFERDPTLVGMVLENFVALELRKQLSWSRDVGKRLFHFRAHTGEEVDAVLERRGGEVVGVEVRATSAARPADFRGLRALAEATGKKFVRGVVLYTGRETIGFARNLHAVPISALWKL